MLFLLFFNMDKGYTLFYIIFVRCKPKILNDILMKYGFVKVAAAIPLVKVADCPYNAEQAESLIAKAGGERGADIGFSRIKPHWILVW